MDEQRKSLVPGLFLIFIGALLLINKITPYHFGWYETYPIAIMGVGFLIIMSIFRKHDKGAIFPGTILLLIGLFFFLRNYELVPYYYVREVWPIFMIIFGLGFFALFLTKPSDWGVLIPGSILLFLGIVLLLKLYHIVYWNIGEMIGQYWPVILIIIGGVIILGSLKRNKNSFES